ncbi:MAG: tRNA preQ1(34) S-adenosylmethionine ribosyltransferase-isomerase QueA [Thermoanaerobaculia bacterium]|nr:tRNA preQ1(34) S-adenosylmethionine ribosyltransferase-isomerase QueA [Thermoanaerobaculia bacterium]
MRTDDFDYHLPEELIAQRPAPRGTSRLLVVPVDGAVRHCAVADLPDLLRSGDLLVVNDTKVIPARLFARRHPGAGRCELLLLERLSVREWRALGRPAKRLGPGRRLDLEGTDLSAEVVARRDDGLVVRFDEPVEPHLSRAGHVPLPPYIRRDDEASDRETYQTIFARHEGAVAAPTAGLHFTQKLLQELEARGVEQARVTLHVGPGTFRPVSAEHVGDHVMDEERYHVPDGTAAAVAACRRRGGRVVAVGTTVVRTLESAAEADGTVTAGGSRTRLFITPGYRFRVVDALLTNFHLPKSTLLMLVSALAGRDQILSAYTEAVEEKYRFYSYGDAMWLEKQPDPTVPFQPNGDEL